MVYPDDPEVFDIAYDLYMKGDVQQAYELLTEAAPKYPEHAQRMFEWRFDMAAKLGKLELSEQILENALDAGCYYGEYALRKDDDMQVMQGRPRFEELVTRSYLMLHRAQQLVRPELTVINEGEVRDGKISLLIALHGNSSNEARFAGNWRSLIGSEWLVALPQSSQVNGKDVFIWTDMVVTRREVIQHYQDLAREHDFNPDSTIIAGFSMGGQAAIRAVLEGWIPAAGFIAIAPYIPDVEAILALLDAGRAHELRGYFLLGAEDKDCTPGATRLSQELVKREITCGLEIFPGVAHAFPADFDAALQRALRRSSEKE